MASARDSLKPLFGDGVYPEDTIFNKLDLVSQFDSEVGMKPINNLEYPLNVGTDEINHFVVFNVFSDAEARLMSAEEQQLQNAQSFINNCKSVGAATGVVVAGGTKVVPKLYGRYATKLPLGGRTKAITTTVGLLGGFQLGRWIGEWIGELWTKTDEAMDKALLTEEEWKQKMIDFDDDSQFGGKLDAEQGRFTRFGKAMIRNQDTIALYMPQKIQSLGVLEYEQQDLSVARNIISNKSGFIKKLGITKIAQGIDTLAGVIGQNTNITGAITASMRMAENPRKQLNFREPVSRKFELNFNLSPRNEMESVRAYQIIQAFKKHAYPKLNRTWGKGTFYNFPAEFQIEYYTMQNGEPVENDWLNKIGRCALREVNVDYAAGGAFSTFENGAPTHMNLSLTFEEMRLIDSELVEEQGY